VRGKEKGRGRGRESGTEGRDLRTNVTLLPTRLNWRGSGYSTGDEGRIARAPSFRITLSISTAGVPWHDIYCTPLCPSRK